MTQEETAWPCDFQNKNHGFPQRSRRGYKADPRTGASWPRGLSRKAELRGEERRRGVWAWFLGASLVPWIKLALNPLPQVGPVASVN